MLQLGVSRVAIYDFRSFKSPKETQQTYLVTMKPCIQRSNHYAAQLA